MGMVRVLEQLQCSAVRGWKFEFNRRQSGVCRPVKDCTCDFAIMTSRYFA